jgi:hypothetical protein
MRFLLTAVFSLIVHLLFGWAWTLVAGVLGGALARRSSAVSGWFVGAGGVALGWAVLVIYNFAVAPASTRILVGDLGQLFGNIPGFLLVGATILIGALLGGLGGLLGQSLAGLTGADSEPTASATTA